MSLGRGTVYEDKMEIEPKKVEVKKIEERVAEKIWSGEGDRCRMPAVCARLRGCKRGWAFGCAGVRHDPLGWAP